MGNFIVGFGSKKNAGGRVLFIFVTALFVHLYVLSPNQKNKYKNQFYFVVIKKCTNIPHYY